MSHSPANFRVHRYSSRVLKDHAVGALLVEEAGGVISDSLGKPLDFGLGRTLGENYGVIAAGRSVHGKVLAAIQQAKEEESAEGKGKMKGPSF